jgi:hypothetical protein
MQSHSLHPGVVNTELFEHSSTDYIPWIRKLFKVITTNYQLSFNLHKSLLLFQTPEEGSRTVVYAAISPIIEGKGGSYLSNCTKWWQHKSARDEVECKKLFDFTCNLLKIQNFGTLA